MNIAYLDCFSGVSGDMLLGALVDTGVPDTYLREVLSGLPLHGATLTIDQQTVQGFAATRVQVACPHSHDHRHLDDIKQMLENGGLKPSIRDKALAVFTRLAAAEAAVHGTTVDRVHFHEVGAVDAIVDIVGTVAGFEYLGIEHLSCSPLPMPGGWVACAHGEIPLPGPAVCHLLAGVPVYGENLTQELVTPTGAALVKELADGFGPLPPMLLARTGYGAGSLQRSDGRPNLLRLLLGRVAAVEEAQEVEVIETHLDDWNPEFWPYVSQQLMTAGALDVCLIPMQMKKGRPGFLLRVIADAAHRHSLTSLLFTETSAIGLRLRKEQRLTLPRESIMVATPWGEVPAKKIITPSGVVITPEYEACRAVAEAHQVPLQAVYAAINRLSPPLP
jgi:hypothetical protein